MWQIFPLLETFRSNLALCSCWSSQYVPKCSRILWGFWVFFLKDGKMWWHENLFLLMKSQQPSLVNKTLVWLWSSWEPSSYNLEPDWFLDVWNRHMLGLLLGYCSSSVTKDGVLFRSLWDFVAGVVASALLLLLMERVKHPVNGTQSSPGEELCCPDQCSTLSQHWTLWFLAQTKPILAQASS